jgi:hypothetical protein
MIKVQTCAKEVVAESLHIMHNALIFIHAYTCSYMYMQAFCTNVIMTKQNHVAIIIIIMVSVRIKPIEGS